MRNTRTSVNPLLKGCKQKGSCFRDRLRDGACSGWLSGIPDWILLGEGATFSAARFRHTLHHNLHLLHDPDTFLEPRTAILWSIVFTTSGKADISLAVIDTTDVYWPAADVENACSGCKQTFTSRGREIRLPTSWWQLHVSPLEQDRPAIAELKHHGEIK